MQNQKKEEDLVKNEREKFNVHFLHHIYKNIQFLNQLSFYQHDTKPITFIQKNDVKTHNFFNVSQFLYANIVLSDDKKKFFLKKYIFFLLRNINQIFFMKHSKKYLIKKKLKKIYRQNKIIFKIKKTHFFSKKIIFFYFKNLYAISGLKKKQPILNRSRRDKYINRLLMLIRRELSLSELFYEKQAKKKMRRIQDFSSKLGVLHYVLTTKNLKLTFTNSKKRVLFYVSCGHKKCKKARRKKFESKKTLNDQMVARVSEMGYKRIIIIFHGRAIKTYFFKKLFRNVGIKVIKRIYKKRSPHNGCRKKRAFR